MGSLISAHRHESHTHQGDLDDARSFNPARHISPVIYCLAQPQFLARPQLLTRLYTLQG